MAKSLLRSDEEITEIYNRHVKTVYRVCYSYMKNSFDTENAVQDTFLKMMLSDVVFESEEHEMAWLIRTASNVCKNYLHHWFYKHEDISDYPDIASAEEPFVDETFEAVMGLPDKYKTALYLYYYEGYNSADIAKMLKKPASTIRNYLMEARKIMKERLGDDFDAE
jgi:RNA polymerase sigma-70 factor (ECF subfamily)